MSKRTCQLCMQSLSCVLLTHSWLRPPERHLHAGRQQARHIRVGSQMQITRHDPRGLIMCLTATARPHVGGQAVMIALNMYGFEYVDIAGEMSLDSPMKS